MMAMVLTCMVTMKVMVVTMNIMTLPVMTIVMKKR